MKLGQKMKALLLLGLLVMSMWPSLLSAQTDATASDTTSDTAATQAERSMLALYNAMAVATAADLGETVTPDSEDPLLRDLFTPALVDESALFLREQIFLPLVQVGNTADSLQSSAEPMMNASAANALFAQLTRPQGLTTDAAGNVYITSDNLLNARLSKFAATSQLLGESTFGNITSSNAIGRLAIDPTYGWIISLSNNGNLLLIHPQTLQVTPFFSIGALSIDTTSVYEFASGRRINLSGSILPGLASYGDIALLRSGQNMHLFITGLSFAFPFVLRITITPTSYTARVVAASLSSAAPNNSVARGVAVNPNGVVLTTLPRAGNNGNYDRAVAFGFDYPENTRAIQPRMLFNGRDISSRGMATSRQGHFYIATGLIGTSACGVGGSGALVAITANLRSLSCLTQGGPLVDSHDIALSPSGTRLYATIGNTVIALP